jgi:hypothetical protein
MVFFGWHWRFFILFCLHIALAGFDYTPAPAAGVNHHLDLATVTAAQRPCQVASGAGDGCGFNV